MDVSRTIDAFLLPLLIKPLFSAEASASWSVVLAVQSQAGGLTVSSPIRQPEYKTQGFHASDMLSFRIDPEELLRQYFRETPDLHGLIHEFKGFEGTWKYSYPGNGAFNLAHPAFNRNGDLLFELRTFAAQGTAFPLSPRRGVHNRGRQNVHGRHGSSLKSMLSFHFTVSYHPL